MSNDIGTRATSFDERILAAACEQGFTLGAAISSKSVQVGDVVYLKSTSACSWSGVSGSPVIRKGPTNVVVESAVRFRPDGPVHVQQHKVPRTEVRYVVRERTLHKVER